SSLRTHSLSPISPISDHLRKSAANIFVFPDHPMIRSPDRPIARSFSVPLCLRGRFCFPHRARSPALPPSPLALLAYLESAFFHQLFHCAFQFQNLDRRIRPVVFPAHDPVASVRRMHVRQEVPALEFKL